MSKADDDACTSNSSTPEADISVGKTSLVYSATSITVREIVTKYTSEILSKRSLAGKGE